MRMYRAHHSKRGRQTEARRTSGWQMVYTGFVLILLCFFIMLSSHAILEQSKINRFTKSFSDAVAVFSDGQALNPGEAMINRDAVMVNKEDKIAVLFDKINRLGPQIGLEGVDIALRPKGVVITLADKMLFTSGDAVLSPAAYTILNKIGNIIKTFGVKVEIEGHTDNVPIATAAYPSNWELSTARAVNVLRYMTEQQHIPVELLSAVGKSQYHPIASNRSEVNRDQNRRVEFVFRPE